MVRYCCVKSCKESWNPKTHLSFFAFPFNNEEMKEKWLKAAPGYKALSKHSSICSDHFSPDDYNICSGRRLLKKNAVPSIFGPMDDAMPSCPNGCHPDSDTGDVETCNSLPVIDMSQIPRTIAFIGPGNSLHVAKQICLNNVQTIGNDRNIYKTKTYSEVSVQTCTRLSGPSEREKELVRKVKVLQGRLRRKEKMLKNTQKLVEDLKKKASLYSIENESLKKFTKFDLALFQNQGKNKNNNNDVRNWKTYTKEMRNFAVTLYSYSPRAYAFVRTKINLPHSTTTRKWKAESVNNTIENEIKNAGEESDEIEGENPARELQKVESIETKGIEFIENEEELKFESAETEQEQESFEIEEVDSNEMEELESESAEMEDNHWIEMEEENESELPETEEKEPIEIEETGSMEMEESKFTDCDMDEEESVKKKEETNSVQTEKAVFKEIRKVESIPMEETKSNKTEKKPATSRPTVLITLPAGYTNANAFQGTLKRYVIKTVPSMSTKRSLGLVETTPK